MITHCEFLTLPTIGILHDLGVPLGGINNVPVVIHLVKLCECGANCAHLGQH